MSNVPGSTGNGVNGWPNPIITNSVGASKNGAGDAGPGAPRPQITNSVGATNHAAKANGGIKRDNPDNVK